MNSIDINLKQVVTRVLITTAPKIISAAVASRAVSEDIEIDKQLMEEYSRIAQQMREDRKKGRMRDLTNNPATILRKKLESEGGCRYCIEALKMVENEPLDRQLSVITKVSEVVGASKVGAEKEQLANILKEEPIFAEKLLKK